MKKAAILGVRMAGIVDAPEPRAKEDWALVKVHAAPMCTEYKAFLAGQKGEFLGHEAAGEVAAVGQPCSVNVGDRVVVMPQYPCGKCSLCVSGEYIHCERTHSVERFTGNREGSATMAQYLVKPAWLLPRIPDGVSYEEASLACCALGPSLGAFQTMGLSAFDSVLITGLGPVGLGAVVNARYRGARVIAVDSVAWRVDRAKALGAEHVLAPDDEKIVGRIKELTNGTGVDCALDCSGNVKAERVCIDAVRRKGKVAFVGECFEELRVKVSQDLIRKGISVIGSWHYNLNDFPRIMMVIRDCAMAKQLISQVLPMSGIQEAFEICASQRAAKVILKPWE